MTVETDPSNAYVLGALEALWAAIRDHHPEIPPVVFVVGAGSSPHHPGQLRRGHWYPERWTPKEGPLERFPEVFVAGERFADGREGVLSTVLHEAAHALAWARCIKDTSRQGRYHNERYLAVAVELGLDVSKGKRHGWNQTRATYAAVQRYAAELEVLGEALAAFRVREDGPTLPATRKPPATARGVEPPEEAPRKPSRRLRLRCACEPPRLAYMSPGTFERGGVHCGECGEAFEEELELEGDLEGAA